MFRSFNVVDEPDSNRKVHVYPIPRVGGMAIAVAYGLSVYLNLGSELLSNDLLSSGLLPAAALVFFTGLVDDFFGLKPWQKILGQITAASVAFWAGVRITGIAGYALADVWSAPLTLGWLLLCTNAVNLVDGLDGLAAGVGLFATLTMFAAAIIGGNQPLAYATLPLAGCLLGFLCFNFNPATVFLGDCGSLLIGFLLGCFGIIWTQKSATLFGITAPLMALSMPLLDVGLCIVRRWLRNQPIFSADRGHIHHKLLDRGLSPRQAVLLLYAFCGAVAILSLVQSFINHLGIALGVVVVFVGLAWAGIHSLNYSEFVLARRLLRIGELKRGVHSQLALSRFEHALLNADNIQECWKIITPVYPVFGFAAIKVVIGATVLREWPEEVTGPSYWTIHLPINDTCYIELARPIGSSVLPSAAIPFAELLVEGVAGVLNRAQAAANMPAQPAIGHVNGGHAASA